MLESIIHSADVELEYRLFVSYFPVCLVATFQLNLNFFLSIRLTYVMFYRKDTSKVYLPLFPNWIIKWKKKKSSLTLKISNSDRETNKNNVKICPPNHKGKLNTLVNLKMYITDPM